MDRSYFSTCWITRCERSDDAITAATEVAMEPISPSLNFIVGSMGSIKSPGRFAGENFPANKIHTAESGIFHSFRIAVRSGRNSTDCWAKRLLSTQYGAACNRELGTPKL